jgi:two-component system cell cycle sensor histidine kinase/response regulator CckA
MVDRHRPNGGPGADPPGPRGPQGESVSPSGRRAGADPALDVETTRRQLAEDAWRDAEEKYRHLVENSEDLIFTHDLDGVILSANPTMARETGLALAELMGRSLVDLLAEEARREFPAYLATVTRDGHAHGFMRIRTRSGEERVLQYDNSLGREAGHPVVRGIAHDVQRRWAEHALTLSVQRLEALLNNIPDLAWMKDEEGRYIAVNEPLVRFIGRSRAGIIGRTDRELLPPDLASRFEESDRGALQSGGSLHRVEEISRRDEPLLVFDMTKTPIGGEGGRPTGTVGVARDITERRQLEEQLVQSQKMEAVGRLAGGVAHDFNNMLTTILGYSGIILDQLSPADSLREEIEEIQKAGERAAALTQQLLAFSRKQVIEPSPIDLNAVVSEASKMLRHLIGEDVELVTRLQTGLWTIRADRGQMDQVLINLAVNARDAMPEGGQLRIETRNVERRDPYRGSGGTPFSHVLLEVADSGTGMDAETRRRIFEPFFTTKERGKGTGLGLATVYGIVKQSGGDIWVESGPGQGTTFQVYLPRVEASVEPVPKRAPSLPSSGSETLLLVEDEESVRRLTTRVLESIGYEVLAAADAAEATRIWESSGGRIRLLITDIIMPGRSGPQLAKQLTEKSPGLKVLYISGYTDSAIVDRGALTAGTALLQKPFHPDALAREVRRLLDSADRASDGGKPERTAG